MNKPIRYFFLTIYAILSVSLIASITGCSNSNSQLNKLSSSSTESTPLRVGIAPYQEMALLINDKSSEFQKEYGIKLELMTLPWEELLPAVASGGQTIDVTFASLPDYLAKTENLNTQGDDPILFVYPAWNFHGGGIISFNPSMPSLNTHNVKNIDLVKKFFNFKIGVQTNSVFHMLLWLLAHNSGIKFSDIHLIDTTLNDGMLAVLNGTLDGAGAGLPQATETIKRHGRVVLTLDTLDFTDVGGFVCKESTYKKRKKEIESLIRTWFDSTNYVLSDLDHNSNTSIDYLKANASTKYTLAEFKNALAHEYIAKSIAEANKEVVFGEGKYSIAHLFPLCNQYLLDIGAIKTARPAPQLIRIQ